MDFSYSLEAEAFRNEVREWLAENMKELPKWWGNPDTAGPDPDSEEYRQFSSRWHRKLYDAGFVGIAWPKEYGGRGATIMEQVIFNEEMAKHRAPAGVGGIGVGWAGPTIVVAGTEEQKRRFLPKILTGEEVWAQCFSEPQAGSDLASLQTRAVQDGDEFVINGQKIWTGGALEADWAILLARTDPDAPKHRGISYFLLDMHAQGVTTRPFKWMTGEASHCEVFLDDVRIPGSLMVGELNQGFYVAMGTLEFERSSLGETIGRENVIQDLIKIMRKMERDGRPLSEDPVIRQKLAQSYIETNILKYMGLRSLTRQLRGDRGGPEANMSFVLAGESIQRLQDFAMQVLGPYSQLGEGSKHAIEHGRWLRGYLASRGIPTIGGGTVEIKRNIIAQRVLGLPRSY